MSKLYMFVGSSGTKQEMDREENMLMEAMEDGEDTAAADG